MRRRGAYISYLIEREKERETCRADWTLSMLFLLSPKVTPLMPARRSRGEKNHDEDSDSRRRRRHHHAITCNRERDFGGGRGQDAPSERGSLSSLLGEDDECRSVVKSARISLGKASRSSETHIIINEHRGIARARARACVHTPIPIRTHAHIPRVCVYK